MWLQSENLHCHKSILSLFSNSKEFYLKLLRIFKTLGKGNMFLLCKTHTNEVFYLFRYQKTVTFVHCELNEESTAQHFVISKKLELLKQHLLFVVSVKLSRIKNAT